MAELADTVAVIVAGGMGTRLRGVVSDRPKVLASIANVFGDFNVSLESVEQRPQGSDRVDIVMLTHRTIEQNMTSALDVLGKLSTVINVESCIRVEN